MSSLSVLALALSLLQLQLLFQLIQARVFERCELAAQLQHRYGLPAAQVATLVCIAQHSSDLNTAAFGGGSGPGGGSHGIFQISDVYWCSPPGQGAGCGLSCARLRDDDIADDVLCVRKIYAEHQRISGDGFTAWQAYGSYCRQDAASYVAGCGLAGDHHGASSYQHPQHQQPQYVAQVQHVQLPKPVHQVSYPPSSKGKIYSRCELAQELYYQHKLPMQQIPTWVCIAQHESSYNTAAVGRLNADGSADHGLFQISDLFWCTHDQRGGKGCHAACNQFLDSSIADDVQCIRKIHQEHTQISGDGFTAWTVYNRDCRNQRYEQVAACFAKPQPTQVTHTHPNAIGPVGKVSYAYQYGQTTTVSPFYEQAHAVSGYQGNPFLRPHPNAIGQSLKPQYAGSSPANPLLYYKHHTTQKQQQQLHYQQQQQHYYTTPKRAGKVYTRCELAQELYFSHKFPMQDLATWVCIAEHESRLDTSAVGRLNADGSADHGLFQISDLYWCGSGGGKGCHIDCNRLLDSDISDDVQCIRTIHEEHTRISGDGFTAWTVYNGHCRDRSKAEISRCFEGKDLLEEKPQKKIEYKPKPKGKIYQRCELAQELYYKHKLPMSEIPTWVCIAQHESSFNTAAVGRLNADGSEDHGLFQISDLYWCGTGGGKACHIDCDRLLDSDISDDVQCVRTIHEEHTRISGDGFTAWTVYNGHCRDRSKEEIASCFEGKDLPDEKPQKKIESKPKPKGKIYQRCELALELYHKHKLPISEIPTWVCIAQYESSFNTAAVGRLNPDGSEDHGLFQISDLYWCSHDKGEQGRKACHIDCDRLLDSDISDDVQCIRTIHEEHTRLSGDGFTAWTVYNGHCRHQSLAQLSDCFDGNEIARTELEKPAKSNHYEEHPQVTAGQQVYGTNPFLKGVGRPQNIQVSTLTVKTTVKPAAQIKVVPNHPYGSNPFLQKIKPPLEPTVKLTESASTPKSSYDKNPFINQSKPPAPNVIQATESKPIQTANYNFNPFLNSLSKPTPAPALVKPPVSTTPRPPVSKTTHRPYVNSDIFRQEIIKFTATSSATTTSNHLRHSQSSTTNAILSITKPTGTSRATTRQPTRPTSTPITTTTHWPITKPSTTTPKALLISTRATTQPTPRPTTRPTIQSTTRTTSSVTTQPTNKATTRPPTRLTTRSAAPLTTRPTTRPTTRTATQPTTRVTTRPTSRVTTRPTTRTTTKPSARATAQPASRERVRPISETPITYKTTNRATARTTIHPKPMSTTRTTARTTTRSTTRASSVIPTTRTTIRSTTIRPYTQVITTKAPARATTTPTTRPTIRSTTRPTTRATTTQPTTRSTTRSTPRATTTRPTKATFTTSSTTKATTRASTTTSRPTTPSTKTLRQFTSTWLSTTPKTTTTTTRTPFQSVSTSTVSRPQSSTTPRPYLFTTTTVASKTTTDPFSHPFFAKFKAKFEHLTTKPNTTTKPTLTPPRFTASPYYAKFQENNNAKGSPKAVYSYSFGRP